MLISTLLILQALLSPECMYRLPYPVFLQFHTTVPSFYTALLSYPVPSHPPISLHICLLPPLSFLLFPMQTPDTAIVLSSQNHSDNLSLILLLPDSTLFLNFLYHPVIHILLSGTVLPVFSSLPTAYFFLSIHSPGKQDLLQIFLPLPALFVFHTL